MKHKLFYLFISWILGALISSTQASEAMEAVAMRPSGRELMMPVIAVSSEGAKLVKHFHVVVLLNKSSLIQENSPCVWSRDALSSNITHTATSCITLKICERSTTCDVINSIAKVMGFSAGNLKLIFAGKEQGEVIDFYWFASTDNIDKWLVLKPN